MSQQNSNHLYLVNSIISAPTDQYQKRQFHMVKLLGRGTEGAVYTVKPINCQYSKNMALKLQLNIKDSENSFIQELMSYQQQFDQDPINASGIISIFEKFKYQNYHALLMELGGLNLYDFIQTNKNLSIQERFAICFDLFRPIYFIHQKGKFHRDIKPENFIQVGNKFKLIDFGLIKGASKDLQKTKGIGSYYYQAPELVEQRTDYNEKVDCWALACVFYELLSGETLIKSDTEQGIMHEILQFKLQKEQYFQRIDKIQIHQDCKEAIKKMLDPNQNKRLSIFDALSTFLDHQENQQPNYQNAQPPIIQNYNQQVNLTQNNPLLQTQQQMYQKQQNIQPKVQQQQLQYNNIQPQQLKQQPSLFQQQPPLLQQQPPLLQQQQPLLQQQQPLLQQQTPLLLQQTPLLQQAVSNVSIEQYAQYFINEIINQILPSQNQNQRANQEIQNQNYENIFEIEFQNAEKDILDVCNQMKKDINVKKNQEMDDLQKKSEAKIQEQESEIKNNNQQLEQKEQVISKLQQQNYDLEQKNQVLEQKNQDLEQQVQEMKKQLQRQNQNYQQENQNQDHKQLQDPNQQQSNFIVSEKNKY
ncbi:unnamed protein product [Paramecium pentaurelia]|uniref:Protein kinase domain-containing protein n=1 Tax=Paramecium pentaurelia TaxID=43138 RepID=A0A8S1W7D8_9CILI|nr:unnamed protein product [Paramecium pentaurelia]